MQVRGLNHLTLAVGDLDTSIAFYRDLLGFALRARWDDGAYLEAGSPWLCLSRDDHVTGNPDATYTHYAFDVAPHDFEPLARRIRVRRRSGRTIEARASPSIFSIRTATSSSSTAARSPRGSIPIGCGPKAMCISSELLPLLPQISRTCSERAHTKLKPTAVFVFLQSLADRPFKAVVTAGDCP